MVGTEGRNTCHICTLRRKGRRPNTRDHIVSFSIPFISRRVCVVIAQQASFGGPRGRFLEHARKLPLPLLLLWLVLLLLLLLQLLSSADKILSSIRRDTRMIN